MPKIIALDIGGKRTGVAETDPLQIIATPRDTVPTESLLQFLEKVFSEDSYSTIVVGDPLNLDGGDSDNSQNVREMVVKLQERFPDTSIILQDERFSSKLALKGMIQSGMKKKKRQKKGEIDKVSAAIILQDYLNGLD